MSDFQGRRRERFLNEDSYHALLNELNFGMADCIHLLKTESESLDLNDRRQFSWRWGIASSLFETLIANYSAGKPVETLVPQFEPMIATMEACMLPQRYRTEPYFLDEVDTYAYAMWLLSLCKPLRLDYLLPRVLALFDVARKDNRGRDALFETLIEKLAQPAVPAESMLKNRKAHEFLLETVQTEPEKRSPYVAQFLKKWYPAMKGTYWYGLHERNASLFFGY